MKNWELAANVLKNWELAVKSIAYSFIFLSFLLPIETGNMIIDAPSF